MAGVPVAKGTRYPAPYDEPCKLRENQPLGLAAGLTQFGVNTGGGYSKKDGTPL